MFGVGPKYLPLITEKGSSSCYQVQTRILTHALQLIVEAVTGIFCSVHQDHGIHFPKRIFGRRIDLKWSEND